MENVQRGASRIVKARKKVGLSQTGLAEELNITREWLSRVEHGRKSPSADLLIRISNTLDINSDVLLADYGYPPPDVVDLLTNDPELSKRVRSMV